MATKKRGTGNTHRKKTKITKRNVFVSIGFFVFLMTAIWIGYFSAEFTGKSIASIDGYLEGDSVLGVISLTLTEGELLPVSSNIQITNNGEVHNFLLSDLIGASMETGDYYLQNADIGGNGDGYGIIGTYSEAPAVSFRIEVIENFEDVNESAIVIVQGEVSIGEEFTHGPLENPTFELIDGSVEADGVEIGEDNLNVELVDNELIVTTDYGSIEEGFGENFVGEGEKVFEIDLNDLGINLTSGEIEVLITFNETEVANIKTSVLTEEPIEEEATQEEATSAEDTEDDVRVEEKEIAEEIFEELPNKYVFENLSLLESEKEILRNSIGMIAVETTAFEEGSYIIVDFNVQEYEMTKTYSISLSDDKLADVLERDSVLFLKDLAYKFSEDASSRKTKEGFSFRYSAI